MLPVQKAESSSVTSESGRFKPVWHSGREQKTILGIVCVLTICLGGGLANRESLITAPVDYQLAQKQGILFKVRINTAPKGELLLLPGIGETLAARIIEHRETVGPFESPEDLEQIRGIGEKKRTALEPWIDFTLFLSKSPGDKDR